MKKLALLFALLFPLLAYSQTDSTGCGCQNCPLFLQDGGSLEVEIPISGILNNDLANPQQGVCGVRLKFDHEYLGDLNISLVSPSNQILQLVGPIGFSGPTDFTTWDVNFVPCDSVAYPDLGFSPIWNSSLPWGMFGEFTGSYYPAYGCLESFDEGPVNGIWRLLVVDYQAIDVGNLYAAELLFCDQAGLICGPCDVFPETAFMAMPQNDGWSVAFSDTAVGVSQYRVDFGDGKSFAGFPAPSSHIYPDTGIYLVQWIVTNGCNSDTAIQEVYVTGNLPNAAFEVAPTCAGGRPVFSILSADHVQSWHWILPGAVPSESFDTIPMVTYAVEGVYEVWLELTNGFGVDTIKMPMAVTITPFVPAIAQFGWVQNGASVLLTNQSIDATEITWILPDGSTSVDSTVSFSVEPMLEYTIILIARNHCSADTVWQTILVDAIPPIADFSMNTQNTCLPVLYQFTDASGNAPTAWEWVFEGGDPGTSSDPNPMILFTQPGPYNVQLAVSNSAGSDTQSVSVVPNLTPAPIAAFTAVVNNGVIVCTNSSQNTYGYSWFLNGVHDTTSLANPVFMVDQSGTYVVALIAWNECDSSIVSHEYQVVISGVKTLLNLQQLTATIVPNPNAGFFLLEIDSDEPLTSAAISIFDTNGREIQRKEITLQGYKNTLSMDVGTVPSGVYALRLQTKLGEKTVRFVVY